MQNVSIPFTRIPYKGRRSRMQVKIRTDGSVVASAPRRISDTELAQFVAAHTAWIISKQSLLLQRKEKMKPLGVGTGQEYRMLRVQAKQIATKHVTRIASVYGFSFGSISIRNQKRRWGSCSSKGNLNFNYRIALLPEDLAEYLVTHEVCHLKQMNHSKAFWDLVAATIPDWKQKRARLHEYGFSEQ